MARKIGGVRSDVVRCNHCGEDYSVAYKRCPFCNAKPGQEASARPVGDDYEPSLDPDDGLPEDFGAPSYDTGRRGGKHLDETGGGHPGMGRAILRVVSFILTLAIIGAAIWIVVTQIIPNFRGEPTPPNPTPIVGTTPPVTPSPIPETAPPVTVSPGVDAGVIPPPAVTGEPEVPAVTASPTVTASPAPSATTLTLSSKDFTLDNTYPTNQMSAKGASGEITWSIKNTAVATVDGKGFVKAVAQGTTTLTATDASGTKAECIVRVSRLTATGQPPAETPSEAPSTSTGSAKLSSEDFTLNATYGLSAQLKVIGGTATAWSSSNTGVATVSDKGNVTGVGSGSCTITVTLENGETLKAIARVSTD